MSRFSEEIDDAFERERRRGSWASGGYGASHNRQPSDEYLRVTTVEKETASAWLLRLSTGVADWFPKSVCRVAPNGSGMLYLRCPQWLWQKKHSPEALRGTETCRRLLASHR